MSHEIPRVDELNPSEARVDYSAFTRDDKVKKNITRAATIPNAQAVLEAKRIKRENLKSAVLPSKHGMIMAEQDKGTDGLLLCIQSVGSGKVRFEEPSDGLLVTKGRKPSRVQTAKPMGIYQKARHDSY